MMTLRYAVRFATPAFLGNAEQSGQWRTPPFKALLRQWWRVVWAAEHELLDVARIREDEASLFGSAGDKGESGRSLVRLRLDSWQLGRYQDQASGTSALGYLGYGRATAGATAIGTDQAAQLSIAVPDDRREAVVAAMALIDAYGTMGGRSRNGWGSVRMESEPAAANADFSQYFRPWQDALDEQWPHALGKDGAPLVWGTKPQADWKGAMERLKEVRKGIYGQMKNAHERALVSYPVTRSKRPLGWDKSYRLPNSLRFKVRPRRDGRVCGVVFHVPCKPTKAIAAETAKLRAIWRRVHGHLDGRSDLQRSRW